MDEGISVPGQYLHGTEMEDVREIISRHANKGRFFISKGSGRLWDWTQANGTPKDMLCRGLLLKRLNGEGHITLPPQRRVPTWLQRYKKRLEKIEVDDSLCEVPLAGLLPLTVLMVRRTPLERLYRGLIRSITTRAIPSPSASTSNISFLLTTGRLPA